jgi:hypothetical protein
MAKPGSAKMGGASPGASGARPTGVTVSNPWPPDGAVEDGFWWGDRSAGPVGTDAVAVPAIRNKAEAVVMTKRFI